MKKVGGGGAQVKRGGGRQMPAGGKYQNQGPKNSQKKAPPQNLWKIMVECLCGEELTGSGKWWPARGEGDTEPLQCKKSF